MLSIAKIPNWLKDRNKRQLLVALTALLQTCSASFAECGGGSTASTPITSSDESATITGSRMLQNGTNTTVDLSVPNVVKINATGGGSTYPFAISSFGASGAFAPAQNTFTDITGSASQINLPASAGVSSGAQIWLTLSGSASSLAINSNGSDKIIFNGSSTSSSITIKKFDIFGLTYKGSGNWIVSTFVPQGGANGTALSTTMGGTGLDGSTAANGKLLIGNGSGFSLNNLTAGSNVSISNSSGNITISSTASSAATVAELPKKQYGDFTSTDMMVKLSTGELAGWGDCTNGALANANSGSAVTSLIQKVVFDPNTTPPPSNASIVSWSFTCGNLYVIYSNGWAYSAGGNTYGQLGHNDVVSRPYLKRIESFVTNSKTITKVWAAATLSATNSGGCVYYQDSAKVLYGCGLNLAGNLASSGTANVLIPTACAGVSTTPYVEDVQIAGYGGYFSTYLVMSDHSILVCGYGVFGQLAQGSTANLTTFTNAKKTGPTNVTDCAFLRANGNYGSFTTGISALYVDTSGNAWGVGINTNGELGLSNITNQNLFTQSTALTNVVSLDITGTPGYAYAIDSSGGVKTWGYNGANNTFRNSATTPIYPPSTASALPGTVSKIFLPRGENTGANAQMIALLSNGYLAFCGVPQGQLYVNSSTSGSFLVPLPSSLSNGTETISDIFVHGTGNTQRWFILTSLGNLYASGNNAGNICTGGASSGTAPTSVSFYKLPGF